MVCFCRCYRLLHSCPLWVFPCSPSHIPKVKFSLLTSQPPSCLHCRALVLADSFSVSGPLLERSSHLRWKPSPVHAFSAEARSHQVLLSQPPSQPLYEQKPTHRCYQLTATVTPTGSPVARFSSSFIFLRDDTLRFSLVLLRGSKK